MYVFESFVTSSVPGAKNRAAKKLATVTFLEVTPGYKGLGTRPDRTRSPADYPDVCLGAKRCSLSQNRDENCYYLLKHTLFQPYELINILYHYVTDTYNYIIMGLPRWR